MDKNKQLSVIGFASVGVAMIITAVVSWILYEHTVSLLTENLRERLTSIAITASVEFEPQDLNVLQVEKDWERPQWSKVVNQLKKIRVNNPDIIFAYILKKSSQDQSKVVFIADSHSINPYANTDNDPTNDVDVDHNGEIDATDVLQWPGQEYEDPPPEVMQAYNGALANRELYSDPFGVFLTGYAPIKDDEGKVVGVIGIDVRANEFLVITSQTLYPFIIFIVFLVIVLVVLATIIISIWNKRVALIAELDRQKDELLGIVSHQLATPVSSVRWNLEMMMDGDLGKLTKEQEESIKSLQGITENLSDLVSMILDVSRIQLGRVKVEKQELDLKTFFTELVEIISPKAKEKKINFIVSIPSKFPSVKLDKRYTHMTLMNLLTNAIKYTPEGGTVNFEVKINNGEMHCKVKDNGIGIPKQDREKIFGKLFRASNVRNSFDGNGFGLYIAKGAIEAQNGKIWFETEENKGSTFFVNLPLN